MKALVARGVRLLAVTGLAAGLILAAQPASAALVTLSQGHVDVIDVNLAGGAFTVKVEDATGATPVERDPADVILDVKAEAETTVPSGSQWSFLGPAGSTVWVLPRVQDPDLLWAGWNTEDVAATGLTGAPNLSLLSVTGPGALVVYRPNGISPPTVLFHSGNGLPDTLAVAAGTHAHETWAFTAPGTYTATFEVTGTLAGGGAATPGRATLTFTVQP